MNEQRLTRALAAFEVLFQHDWDRKPHATVNWKTTVNGWEMQPSRANWQLQAPTMDGCVDLFIAKILECAAKGVRDGRAHYEEQLVKARKVETEIG